jgi:benzoyl-CoA reductase/2-hydroxyglutaryl-CoA dehydratase subunit BcrC/BadD/HgdB
VIGITTTVPVEIIYAAGLRPVDLNNLFITSPHPSGLVARAESEGFSHNTCAWIKGIYAVVLERGIQEVIAVTGGDCSNTVALAEVLMRRGIRVIPFEYPFNRDREALADQMEKLRRALSARWPDIHKTKERLDRIRAKLEGLDRLTYRENRVTGGENHLYLVSSSDFNGDPDTFEADLDLFLDAARGREGRKDEIRLGYLGVPPIFSDLYECIESFGARVVYNEIQRQFSLPFRRKELVDLYLEYTYPYDINGRLADIERGIKERALDGLIHYTQTFCHRQIYDIVLRETFHMPILTLEGDRPGPVDNRTAFRIETFIEMLRGDPGEG